MAAAEARAVWQRAANRCFVQEDAKRAPKLACCQSSCATSKSADDAGPASAANESNQVNVSAMPFYRNSSFSNISPDSKWWLHSQPNYGYQKSSTYENLNSSLMGELETLKALDGNEKCKGEVTQFDDESHDSSYYMHCDFQTNDAKKALKDKMQEAYSKNSELSDMMSKHETLEINPVSCSVSMKTNDSCLGSDYSWIEGDRTEPWWRTTDRDELALFVSKKSHKHFENCDLPPPQKKYLRSHPCANANANDHKTKTTSFDWEAKSKGFSDLSVHARECLNPNLIHGNQGPPAKEEISNSASDKSSSTTAIHDNIMEKQQIFEGDPSKAQLMEALCHSQKRAREAEEAARQAYAEKEDLVKLFFKQASQIFAYKQWLQLLQLETLYFQVNKVNSKDQLISTLFPTALPSMSRKPRKRKQDFVGSNQEMQDQAKPDITTYAVAFALGLSLVGAGILLGWTVGGMLPHL